MERRIFDVDLVPVTQERLNNATVTAEQRLDNPFLGATTHITVIENGVETHWLEIAPDVVVERGRLTRLPPVTEEQIHEREREAAEFKARQENLPRPVYAEGEDPDVWDPRAREIMEPRVGDVVNAVNACHDNEHEYHRHLVVLRKVLEQGGEFGFEAEVIDGPLCGTETVTVTVWPLWKNDLAQGSTPWLGNGEGYDVEVQA